MSHREVRISRASLNCSEMIPGGLTLEVEKLAWYDRDPHKPIGLELDKRRRKLPAILNIDNCLIRSQYGESHPPSNCPIFPTHYTSRCGRGHGKQRL